MRIVEEIPHELFKITVFSWNGKYIIKIELDSYEQVYKIMENDVSGLGQIKQLINDKFLEDVFNTFVVMRNSLAENFRDL